MSEVTQPVRDRARVRPKYPGPGPGVFLWMLLPLNTCREGSSLFLIFQYHTPNTLLAHFQKSVIQLLKIFFLSHGQWRLPGPLSQFQKLLEALLYFVSDQWDLFLRTEVNDSNETLLGEYMTTSGRASYVPSTFGHGGLCIRSLF